MKFKKILVAAAVPMILSISPAAAEEAPKSSQEIAREALEASERTGIKVGMTQQEVFERLGQNFVEETLKVPSEERVFTWHRDDRTTVTVTISDGKVKGVSHLLSKGEDS